MEHRQVVIVGAGASGLMCAIEAAKRGRDVLVIDHANKAGKKILMSGGGRCNFTNYSVEAGNYISANQHFCKSALSRFTQWDFLAMVDAYKIAFHEREHGQLFCNESSKDILNMLLAECRKYKVDIQLKFVIENIASNTEGGFSVTSVEGQQLGCDSLVIATGGLSIPKMGASPFGYRVAEQFALKVNKTRAGLVPFTLLPEDKARFSTLSGIAVQAVAQCGEMSFRENILFTHRGLSGPVILQISSYWQVGQVVCINLLPDRDLKVDLALATEQRPNLSVKSLLAQWLPKRLLEVFVREALLVKPLKQLQSADVNEITECLQTWQVKPNGTEGYRTAEVTLGGVDCNEISSKTFEANNVPGLYFVGEVLDVTGWLGGYNFQWAWASGWCAGQYV